jgi:hypothetical protein
MTGSPYTVSVLVVTICLLAITWRLTKRPKQ